MPVGRGSVTVPIRKQLEELIGECIVKGWTKVAALLLSVATIQASAQSAPEGQGGAQETQARGFWTDPSTALIAEISEANAIKKCKTQKRITRPRAK